MAVQKSRKTPSKRGMRRSHDALSLPTLSIDRTSGEVHRRHHDALSLPTLSIDRTSGEVHRRHHVTPNGYYRGRKVVTTKAVAEE